MYFIRDENITLVLTKIWASTQKSSCTANEIFNTYKYFLEKIEPKGLNSVLYSISSQEKNN